MLIIFNFQIFRKNEKLQSKYDRVLEKKPA